MQNMWRSPEFGVIPRPGEEARLLLKGGDKWPIPDYETLIGATQGGGGWNFTGSWSGTLSVSPVCKQSAPNHSEPNGPDFLPVADSWIGYAFFVSPLLSAPKRHTCQIKHL